jgi:hypothetical protein
MMLADYCRVPNKLQHIVVQIEFVRISFEWFLRMKF